MRLTIGTTVRSMPRRLERGVELLGDEVAELPFGLGAEDVERGHGDLPRAEFRLAQERADLRSVPVRHDEFASPGDDRDQRGRGAAHLADRFAPGAVIVRPLDRVAAEGDQDPARPPRAVLSSRAPALHDGVRPITHVMQWAPPYPPVISRSDSGTTSTPASRNEVLCGNISWRSSRSDRSFCTSARSAP